MNLRICFQGLKSTKEEQIAHLEEILAKSGPGSRYFDPNDEIELRKAIVDVSSLEDDEFSLRLEVARDEIFYDCTELGLDYV